MKKLALSLVVAGVVANSAFAEGAFVGVEGGVAYQLTKINNVVIETKDTKNFKDNPLGKKLGDKFNTITGAIGIKGGYDFGDFRAYAQYNHIINATNKKSRKIDDVKYNFDTKISSHEILAGADYFFYKAQNIKAFGGAYAGVAMRTIKQDMKFPDNPDGGDPIKENKNAFLFGAKVGGIYSINAHNDIEFGAKADKPFHKGGSVTKITGFAGYTYKF